MVTQLFVAAVLFISASLLWQVSGVLATYPGQISAPMRRVLWLVKGLVVVLCVYAGCSASLGTRAGIVWAVVTGLVMTATAARFEVLRGRVGSGSAPAR